ncbi:MAG: 3-dehydroquinate synthase [Alphaproteobacteria bacterium]|nr:3-dehydroquinate synthase [Alphaproteobacteria bacterium]
MSDAGHSSGGEPVVQVPIELGPRSYEIVIGDGLLARAGEFAAPVLRQPRAFVVSDARVAELYLEDTVESLTGAGVTCDSCVVPGGEASKSFQQLETLVDRMLAQQVERDTTVIALGGGVVGDLAGFAASIVLRGLDMVQIPTTLLAQVDSSVGGKTGINTGHGKNLVGSFHQPKLVLADIRVLDTLPRRELLAGYAEVVKYGLIGDAAFFSWLEANGQALLGGDGALRQRAIEICCRAKAAIVAADEREGGQRALLNLGHTFGHALEAEVGYEGGVLHGEAIAVGMVLAFALSARLGLAPAEEAARVEAHLSAVGLPTRIADLAHTFRTDALLSRMGQDKKVRDGRLTFVLARGIGSAFLSAEVPEDALRQLLAQECA